MATTEKGIYYPYDYTKTADVLADMKTMAESVDAAIEKSKYNDKDIKDEIKNIQNEQKTQNKSIEANTTKNTEQDKLIQKLQSNMINESTEEATSLYVEDASDLPAKLNIAGNHYQETQEGTSNLAVLNEGTITQNGITVDIQDGVATVSGTNTSDAATYITIGTAYLYANKTYYLRKEQGTAIGSYSLYKNGQTKWFEATGESSIEVSETGEWSVRYSVGANASVSGTLKFGVYENAETEYVVGKKAVPSVEYPSQIRTVGDNINILPNNFNSKTENGLECTVNNDKSINVVGTATATTHLILVGSVGTDTAEEVLKFKANKQYKNISNVDVLYQKTDNSYGRLLKDTEFTFENDTSIRGLYLQINSGETVDETYYPKIVEYYEGIDESYSPYNMGSVKITKVNKNMFILPASNLLGVEVAPKEDGTYKLNGTSTTSWAYRNGEYFWISPGKYTIFAEGLEELISAIFGIGTEDNSWKAEINTGIKEYTFTVTEKMKVRSYFTCNSTAIFNNNIIKVQLEKSDTKTGWVKHEQQEYILPIQQEMLEGDYFDLKNDKEVHDRNEVTLTGTENISINTDTDDYIEFRVNDVLPYNSKTGYNMTYSTHFSSTTNNRCVSYNKDLLIRIPKPNEFTTVELFKSWLQENNVDVYYQLAEMLELDLTKEQKEVLQQLNNLDLYKGTNNIYTDQDLALLQLDYTVDTKMYIDNKIANTNAQVLNM